MLEGELIWHAGAMPSDPTSGVPFYVGDGWPDRLAGAVVTASEAGVLLGSLLLADSAWASLRASIVFALRIDDHPVMDGLTTRYPDGSEEHREFAIPVAPSMVPTAALTSSRTFSDWVGQTHGLVGRLLVWDRSQEWWIVNEPDLEVQILCAPVDRFERDPHPDQPFSWLPRLTDHGRQQVAYLTRRYGLDSVG
jgi:hypothetical protein